MSEKKTSSNFSKAAVFTLVLTFLGILGFMEGWGEEFAKYDEQRHNIATAWLVILISSAVVSFGWATLNLLFRK